MKTRNIFLAVGFVTTVAIVTALVLHALDDRRATFSQSMAGAASSVAGDLSNAAATAGIVGPRLSAVPHVLGGVTTVSFTVTNTNAAAGYRDIAISGLSLAQIAPRESNTLPIRIPRLAAGESFSFDLHYDGLQWLGPDVPADRLDTNWATKPLDDAISWKVELPASAAKSESISASGSSNTRGAPIALDPAEARAMKAARDLATRPAGQ